METKFEPKEKALLGDKEVVILVAAKDFSTRKIRYRLESGELVQEEELTKIGSKKVHKLIPPKPDNVLSELTQKYFEVVGKTVPGNKKNDLEWIIAKIEATQLEKADGGNKDKTDEDPSAAWDIIAALELDQLQLFVKEKGLDIDIADYADLQDLQQAVAEEMGIEIPQE